MFGKNTNKALRVLLVEDNPDDAEIIQDALEQYRRTEFELVTVDTIKAARSELKRSTFDVVLLDYNLPGENGLDLLRAFNGSTEMPPVIMLTGQANVLVARDSILYGAQNYLVKDQLNPKALGEAIRDALGSRDIERQVGAGAQDLQKLAFIDSLTGLYNQRYLDHVLDKECTRTKRYHHWLSCVMISVDSADAHAEAYGVAESDSLLRQVSALIRSGIRDSDIATRYGDTAFCLLLPETDRDQAFELAERLCYAIGGMQVVVKNQSVAVTTSVGVFTPQAETQLRPSTILDNVNAALRKAGAAGQNQVSEYASPELADTFQRPAFGS
ncbi:MAG: diguanylate cyclase [Chloroflexi bacterium]|nr:diguanylate cyclase [Chloroflexota bacterium]